METYSTVKGCVLDCEQQFSVSAISLKYKQYVTGNIKLRLYY